MKYKIAIDLDGVLADFDHRVTSILGSSWKLMKPDILWRELEKEKYLFNTLQPMSNAHKLVTHLMHHDLFILTATPRPTGNLSTAAQDKKDWVSRHINKKIQVHTVLGGKNKGKFVQDSNSILIDDFPRNIDVWKASGGIGVLHTSVDDTLDQLDKLGVI